ncbi:MAG: nucleotidyltransferase family protein [Patescibacteria group bacterium]
MKAVLLVGGQGTRLRPVTYEIPKPLITVGKKPIVNHAIEFLDRHGIDEVGLLAARGHADDFRRWRKGWADELPAVKINMFYEESPRGTFGGFEVLREWLGNETFVVSNGDDLKDFDLTAMIVAHRKSGAVATVALMRVPDPENFGVPLMEGNRIVRFLEKPSKPPSDFVNGGLYVMEPAVFDYVDFKKPTVMIERDLFPALAEGGLLYGFRGEGARCFDCGTLERWERAMNEW